MLISEQSPLRRIPQSLAPKQIIFYDGLRLTIETLDVAYYRLEANLINIATEEKQPLRGSAMAVALLDAWSIVDSTNRLRNFMEYLPSITKITKSELPERIIFLKDTKIVVRLRNQIQHLEKDLEILAQTDEPVLGTLGWFAIQATEGDRIKTGRCNLLISGTLPPKQRTDSFVNPAGKTFHRGAGLVTLSSLGLSLCITDIIEQVGQMVVGLEREMVKRFEPSEAVTDVYMRLGVEFGD
jgi:hypothetical protein